jgi:hypothetical protein
LGVLSFQVEVDSGISPPTAILDAMASRPTASITASQPSRVAHDPAYPPQLGTAGADEVDAPPSYEDHVADEIAPLEGVTRHYSGVTDVNSTGVDDAGGSRSEDLEDEPPPFDEASSSSTER